MQNEFDAAAAGTGSDDRAGGPAPFFKMHGLGNDFVILDARRGKPFAEFHVTAMSLVVSSMSMVMPCAQTIKLVASSWAVFLSLLLPGTSSAAFC